MQPLPCLCSASCKYPPVSFLIHTSHSHLQVRDFVYISDRAYTKEQILGMEKIMLNTLKFNLTVPTSHNFLTRYLKVSAPTICSTQVVVQTQPADSTLPSSRSSASGGLWAPVSIVDIPIAQSSYEGGFASLMVNHSETIRRNQRCKTSFTIQDCCVLASLQAAGLAADAVAGHYAAYLVELALPDYGMLKYSNSMVAVAAVQLTNRCAVPPIL